MLSIGILIFFPIFSKMQVDIFCFECVLNVFFIDFDSDLQFKFHFFRKRSCNYLRESPGDDGQVHAHTGVLANPEALERLVVSKHPVKIVRNRPTGGFFIKLGESKSTNGGWPKRARWHQKRWTSKRPFQDPWKWQRHIASSRSSAWTKLRSKKATSEEQEHTTTLCKSAPTLKCLRQPFWLIITHITSSWIPRNS